MKRNEPADPRADAREASRDPAARAPRRDRTTPTTTAPGPRPIERPVASEGTAAPAVAYITVGRGESGEHLFRRLLGSYLGGARELVLTERPRIGAPTREVVRTFCRRTRQPEIISDEGSTLRLRDLAYDSPVALPQRLHRMGRLVVEFHREAVDSWGHLPLGEDTCWERRDDEFDREAWYIQRLAALRLGDTTPGGPSYLGTWTVARSLERIADHAVMLGEAGRRLGDLPSGSGPVTSLKQFHRQAMEHLEGVLAVTDGAVANDLLDMGEALIASGRALSERLLPGVNGGAMPPAAAATVARILESIGRTVAYGQDIAQVVLDRSILLAGPEAPGASAGPVPAI